MCSSWNYRNKTSLFLLGTAQNYIFQIISKLVWDKTFVKRFTFSYFHKRHILTFCPYIIWSLLNRFSRNTVKLISYIQLFPRRNLEINWKIDITHHRLYHVQQSVISPLSNPIIFIWGAPGGVSCNSIPHYFKYSMNFWFKYSPPQSNLSKTLQHITFDILWLTKLHATPCSILLGLT